MNLYTFNNESENYFNNNDESQKLTEKFVENFPQIRKELEAKTSKNVFFLRYKLVKNAFQPLDIYFYYRSKIKEKVNDLESINIFEKLEYLLLHRKGKYDPQGPVKSIYDEF
jgi:hypothetical protein